MPYEQFANNAATTLSAGCTNVATSISVTSSTGFPTATNGGQFRVLIGTELLIVTAISGTTWTVTRGAEGSTAAAHSSGDAVTHIITRDSLYQFGLGGGDFFRSGYYSHGLFSGGSLSTQSLTLNAIYYRPFWVPVRRAFDRIGVYVATGGTAGAVLRLGIYTNSSSGPTSLIVDAGTVASTATGAAEITISQTLDPGLYWIATVPQTASCTVNTYAAATYAPWPNANQTAVPNGLNHLAYLQTGVSGALPSTATPGTGTQCPAVCLRAA